MESEFTENKRFILLPHEVCFGALLLSIWFYYVMHGALFSSYGWLYTLAISVNSTVIIRAQQQADRQRWQQRLGFYLIAIPIVMYTEKHAIALINPWHADAILVWFDNLILGNNQLGPSSSGLLNDILSLVYLAAIPYTYATALRYLAGELERAKAFFAGLTMVCALVFMAAVIFPGQGAFDPKLAIAGIIVTPTLQWLYPYLNNGASAFPSLLVATSVYCCYFDYKHARDYAKVAALPVLLLCLAACVLKISYLISVIASIACLPAASLILKRMSQRR